MVINKQTNNTFYYLTKNSYAQFSGLILPTYKISCIIIVNLADW